MHISARWRLGFAGIVAGVSVAISSVGAANAQVSTDSYIISVPEGANQELASALDALAVDTTAEFTHAIDGAAAELTPIQVNAIEHAIPGVSVTVNGTRRLSETQPSATWGIDSLDQSALFPDTNYTYPPSAGTGVDVFIIDTGLAPWTYAAGGELVGRVRDGRAFIDGVMSADTAECIPTSPTGVIYADGGHGTHVAGTVASKTYGVAKRATIVPLRVFGCPTWKAISRTYQDAQAGDVDILSAIDYAIANHQSTRRPGVINLSLGGGCVPDCAHDILNLAVANATHTTTVGGQTVSGLTVTVAAGNDGELNNSDSNACNSSPASAAEVITVGSTDIFRGISYFSNYGPCVEVFAPGEDIRSLNAYYGLDSSSRSTFMSGTSMASPHVAGVAALYLALHPSDEPAAVMSSIVNNALSGVVSGLTGRRATSPNIFANTTFLNNTLVTLSAPATLTAVSKTTSSMRLNWSAPTITNGIPPSDYRIQYRQSGSSAWSLYRHTALGASRTISLAGLSRGQTYSVRVAPMLGSQVGSFSTATTLAVLNGLASAPRSLVSTGTTTTTASLMWQAPLTTNGSTVSDYRIQYRVQGVPGPYLMFSDGVSTSLGVTLSSLARGTTYQIRVFAVTPFGIDTTQPSNAITVTTQP